MGATLEPPKHRRMVAYVSPSPTVTAICLFFIYCSHLIDAVIAPIEAWWHHNIQLISHFKNLSKMKSYNYCILI